MEKKKESNRMRYLDSIPWTVDGGGGMGKGGREKKRKKGEEEYH